MVTDQEGIGTGTISSSYKIGFRTPLVADNAYIHWRPTGVDTSAAFVQVDLYEDNAYTGGATVVPVNRNRQGFSASVADMQDFKTGVTATISGSTLIQHAGIGSAGNPASRSGGGSGADQELVLKADTDYVMEITPSNSTQVLLSLFWYEEEGFTP